LADPTADAGFAHVSLVGSNGFASPISVSSRAVEKEAPLQPTLRIHYLGSWPSSLAMRRKGGGEDGRRDIRDVPLQLNLVKG